MELFTKLGFFEHDVLANNRVIFLHLELSRSITAIFYGGVEIAGICGALELDFNTWTFFCHLPYLLLLNV